MSWQTNIIGFDIYGNPFQIAMFSEIFTYEITTAKSLLKYLGITPQFVLLVVNLTPFAYKPPSIFPEEIYELQELKPGQRLIKDELTFIKDPNKEQLVHLYSNDLLN